MAKLIVFNTQGFQNQSKTFYGNDPDLTLNGDDFTFAAAMVASGSWTLCSEPTRAGDVISIHAAGGPDNDGCYKDHADWGGAVDFHVKSIAVS